MKHLSLAKTMIVLSGMVLIMNTKVFAQESDYVVTIKGDTIKGDLVIHLRSGKPQSASIKTADNKQLFKVYELQGAGKADGTVYRTKKILGKYQFAQLIKEGYLSYYMYSAEEIQAEKFSLPVLIKRDGQTQTFSNMVFKKRISEFLDDCETVKLKFDNNAYKRKDLLKIIDEYNDCIEQKTNRRERKPVTAGPVDQDKLNRVKELVQAANQEASLAKQSEILEMLHDVEQKVENGEAIPGYLAGALKENLADYPDLLALLEAIL